VFQQISGKKTLLLATKSSFSFFFYDSTIKREITPEQKQDTGSSESKQGGKPLVFC